ncbi:hypothetical protein, partial [Ensifer sp. NM-2]|uniref:hypothetical protein n=1 Tax=Ensifer sp. NM-2 TaxID=2109730 RepID=UPI001AEC770D
MTDSSSEGFSTSLQIVAQKRRRPKGPAQTNPERDFGSEESDWHWRNARQNANTAVGDPRLKAKPKAECYREIHNCVTGGLGAKSNTSQMAGKFHKLCYLIFSCSRVHSIFKCDMPMISMVSPWRFWDVTKLFAAESGGSSPPLSLCRTQGAD